MNWNIFDNATAGAVLGALIALVPFLGFPAGFEDFLLIVAGAYLAVFAYRIRDRGMSKETKTKSSEVFSESMPKRAEDMKNHVGGEMRAPSNEDTRNL